MVERTGVGREAIRFYINEGLLPRPEKTAPNMAWYSERHIELLKLIRRLQDDQFLPLKAIKSVLHNTGEHEFSPRQLQVFARMREQLAEGERLPHPPHELSKLARYLNLAQDEIQAFRELGLLREKATRLTGEEESMLRLWASIRDAGLTRERGISPRIVEMIVEAADLLFDREIRLFENYLNDLDDREAEALMRSVIPDINRMFEILHRRRIRAFISRYAGQEPDTD
ncbi:MerR family transcriptional regulator [Salinisphaera sp. PC39]